MSQNLIITISRQYGSGGRETGVLLSKQMDIPMYDRELQTVAAARSGIDLKLLENVDETASNSLLYTLVMKSGNNITDPSTLPLSDKLFAAQSEIIREYAAQGSCIFVGRCADFVLRNHPNVVKVFIHSEINARINRIKRLHQVNAREAEADIYKTDRRRASYYNRNTQRRWGKAEYYDLSLSSSEIGVEGCAQMMADFVKIRKDFKMRRIDL